MGRLQLRDRRLIAIYAQHDGKTEKQIVALGFARQQVRLWKKVDFLAPDVDFADQLRVGRPHLLSDAMEDDVMTFLESDIPGVVAAAALKFKCSTSTIKRIADVRGEMVSRHVRVYVSEEHSKKRVTYSRSQKGEDHSKKCWVDHSLISVPPEPTRQRVWRAYGSKKPVPRAIRWKSKTSFLMLVAGCSKGVSKGLFAAQKVRSKKRKRGQANPGYRWETYTVNTEEMKEQLEELVFPFMEENDLDECILDNASCQDGLAPWIRKKGFKSPGFASARRNDPGGIPQIPLILIC